MTKEQAKRAAEAIARDIADRQGIGDQLSCIDNDIQDEMIQEWASIIELQGGI